MTIFGPDISSFQRGVDVSRLQEPFVLLKCTEGSYYADADYPTWLAQAKASGKLAVAYHFISGEDPGVQAAHLRGHILDPGIPVMIDWEPEGSFKPTFPQLVHLVDAINGHGMTVRLAYAPRWHWSEEGAQDLLPLRQRGVETVSSAYPGRRGEAPAAGYASAGGDAGPGWEPYGGSTPVLWQFTDNAVDQQHLDFNAFRGTIDQLAALLGSRSESTGGDVNLTDKVTISPGFAGRYPRAGADGFTANAEVPVGVLLEGAALRAVNNEHLLGDVLGKLDNLLNKPSAPVVDTTAIANQIISAISEHFAGGADVHAIAAAVQAQLAQALGSHGGG